jgi:hypothetical protein
MQGKSKYFKVNSNRKQFLSLLLFVCQTFYGYKIVVCKNAEEHSHRTRFYINLLSSLLIRYSCTISVIDPLSLVCKQRGYHNQNTCFTGTYMPYLTDSLLGYFVYNSKLINHVSNTPCHRSENFMMIRPNVLFCI